jgi:proline-specific peptidase
VCRLKEWPPELRYSLENVSRPVYHTMNGPNEFTIIGNIRYWDLTDRLRSISVPTLVTCGKHDEVSPRQARSIQQQIRGARLVVFPRSSHLPFWEERHEFMNVMRGFLEGVERTENRRRANA